MMNIVCGSFLSLNAVGSKHGLAHNRPAAPSYIFVQEPFETGSKVSAETCTRDLSSNGEASEEARNRDFFKQSVGLILIMRKAFCTPSNKNGILLP